MAVSSASPRDRAWPDGKDCAIALTFDVDAEAGFLGTTGYEGRLSCLAQGTYAIRRGLPRVLDLLTEFGARSTFFVPGYVLDRHPAAPAAIVAAGHELGHHGHLHLRPDEQSPESQRVEIEEGLAAFARAGLSPPIGYRAPWAELTAETFALLVEHGFGYDSSSMGDDRPYTERSGGLDLLEFPIHYSLVDVSFLGWGTDPGLAPGDLSSCWRAEYESARVENRVATFTMHPEVIGRANGIRQLRELLEVIAADGAAWLASLAEIRAWITDPVEAEDRA